MVTVTCIVCLTCVLLTVISASCPRRCVCNSSNHISCSNISLTKIPRNLSPTLTLLDVSENQLSEITNQMLSAFHHMVDLKMKNNEIVTIADGAFVSNEELRDVDLSGNLLTRAHQGTLRGLWKVIHLDLSNNNLAHIDGAFAGMSELSRLDLSNNAITKITQFTFRDLTNLRYLHLAGNNIAEINQRAFINLSKLMHLMLKANPIYAVPRLQFDSSDLSYIDLSECELQKLPHGLPNSVRYMQLRRNNMTTIGKAFFEDFLYVSIMVLDDNGIVHIEDGAFKHLTYLGQLWLNNNKLDRIPRPLPTSLLRLLMDGNRIRNISSGTFPTGSRLNTLSLMGNEMEHIEYNVLHTLLNLTSVDFSSNHLQHIYPNTFRNASTLHTLQLSKNPLTYFHSRCFHGLTSLKTLSLAYIESKVAMYFDIFQELTQLRKLDLDSSPDIIRMIFSDTRLLHSLVSVADLSMLSSDMTHIDADFPNFFSNLSVLHISSGQWHCDTHMIWFKDWLQTTSVDIENLNSIRCFTPRKLHGRSIVSLSNSDFVPATQPTSTPSSVFRLTTFMTRLSSVGRKTTTTARPVEYPDYADEFDEDDFNKHSTHEMTNWVKLLSLSTTTHKPDRTRYRAVGGRLDIRTHIKSTTRPVSSADSSHSDNGGGDGGESNVTLIVLVATAGVIVLAGLLAVLIVFYAHKQKRKDTNLHKNSIKYKHKNNVLYFMPNSESAVADGSLSESVKTSSSREGMSLIPGRDINHEGPLRVYNWEEF